ncbi:MAG: UDP-3-O-acyl-N-acetylglucosamine deacetylase [Gammaproteobacteria bacterium]
MLKTIEVQDGDKWASYAPDQLRRFSVGIDFASRVIGQQHYSMVLQGDAFSREIASARTFGFREQIDALRERGLTLGGSLDNAILIDGDRIMNPQGLRYPDEFVRHKLLDSIGDLYLAGAPILGHYRAYKPGHGMNAALLRAMLSDTSAWRMVTSAESVAQSASRSDSERLRETG